MVWYSSNKHSKMLENIDTKIPRLPMMMILSVPYGMAGIVAGRFWVYSTIPLYGLCYSELLKNSKK